MAYSSDSKIFAYSARLNNKEFVVADGIRGNTYDHIMGMGKVIFDAVDTFHYLARKDGKVYLIEEKF